ncbi:hypothetical protein HMPREF1991_00423 [Hoylesella loescheii DSM 19665 = JCM 12249 = ATCC 15930]|uniref:Uncharacterized protein n=1 Tax=Hoylesella loescheii DSM 19665 = JCM 12249 = ATCC 15930 TaxID=1122985 RepID=A0A069QKQ5_HOYLO|nr:hypothetical protein HMPREF1991_00423 [Hoylesella loescheii DSM 19665 = JCM 12249 = ATCC 15930]
MHPFLFRYGGKLNVILKHEGAYEWCSNISPVMHFAANWLTTFHPSFAIFFFLSQYKGLCRVTTSLL